MNLENIRLTSETFWQSALVTALIDVLVVSLLAWRINKEQFRRLRWPLVVAGTFFWSVFGLALYQVFWDSYYRYIATSWLRGGGILLVTVFMGAGLTLLFHWASLRLPGNPLVTFCLLGGLESLLEHLLGIFGMKILAVPMLQGVSPVSVLAFAFPEYIVYWCVVIILAMFFQTVWRRLSILPLHSHILSFLLYNV